MNSNLISLNIAKMKKPDLKVITTSLLSEYLKKIPKKLESSFNALRDSDISTKKFNFYSSVSAITSSRIEGEQMEVDSYIKHKLLKIEYQKDLVEKPNDLYKAYIFAQKNKLTSNNFVKAHTLLAKHLLPKNKLGKYRKVNLVVMEHKTGRIQYEAASATEVKKLMTALWKDIDQLVKRNLNTAEVFYFASFIHVVFVNIHPFEDGNGRAGRLLEKWFIAEKLGAQAWFLQSELNYYNNVNDYYKNLNRLGFYYDQLDYTKALPFLLMLPKSLERKK
jgi:Fic family protein